MKNPVLGHTEETLRALDRNGLLRYLTMAACHLRDDGLLRAARLMMRLVYHQQRGQ